MPVALSLSSPAGAAPRRPAFALLRRHALAWAVAACLGGCGTLGSTPYVRPDVDLPGDWRAAPQADAAGTPSRMAAGLWWRQFGDPALDALVAQALARNGDARAAALNVRRALLQHDLARRALWPTPAASSQSSVSRALDGGGEQRAQSASLSVSYEVDLWHRLGSARDAAAWEAQATEQDRRAVLLALVGSVVEAYWNGGYLDQRIATARDSIATARRTLDIVRARHEAGAVSTLEVREAEQSLLSQQAAHSQLEQARTENRNTLAVLLGGSPDPAPDSPAQLPDQTLPTVDAGLPAQLLGQRPDLAALEMRLREALAQTDATRASFYPSLTLTGALGTSSDALLRLLQNPVGALGAGIALPFLAWKDMGTTIRLSETDYDIAVAQFRQKLQTALSEVENALSARARYQEQAVWLRESLARALQVESIYETRYREGAVALSVWLDAQEKRRTAQTALVQNTLNRLLAHASLHQALGSPVTD